jgi:hypothetical protein
MKGLKRWPGTWLAWAVPALFLLAGWAGASDSYLLWTSGDSNQPPEITSEAPLMVNRTYEYDVDATDADGDALSFSLNAAPDGMTIDAVTGEIVWTAAPDQIGSFTPVVIVDDKQGGTDSQTIPLTVTEETFTTMTVAFLEGVNLQDGATEQDDTVLSLGAGADMSEVTDIVLPNVDELFSFSTLASFHVELQGGTALIVPESTVAQIAIEDTDSGGKAFAEILSGTLSELSWTTPDEVTVSDTTSVVFERSDGSYLKIGQFTLNLTEGTLTLSYADVTP